MDIPIFTEEFLEHNRVSFIVLNFELLMLTVESGSVAEPKPVGASTGTVQSGPVKRDRLRLKQVPVSLFFFKVLNKNFVSNNLIFLLILDNKNKFNTVFSVIL